MVCPEGYTDQMGNLLAPQGDNQACDAPSHQPQSAASEDRYRIEADKAAQSRNEAYERSQAAWKSGNKAGAKHWSSVGKEWDKKMRQYNDRCRRQAEVEQRYAECVG